MNTEAISAGATLRFHIPGRYFRLVGTTGPVSVVFFRNGAIIAESENVEAGYAESFLQASDGFEAIEVSSATDQTIKFAVRVESSLSYDRAVGNVSITNTGGAFGQFSPTIGTASLTVRPANALRRYLLVQNKSPSVNMYVNLAGANASIGNGVKIGPGDSLEIAGFCPTGDIRICSDVAAAAGDCCVLEG